MTLLGLDAYATSSLVALVVSAFMLDAALKALSQILSPPMRAILWKSIALALVLIVALATALQRLLSWLATSGMADGVDKAATFVSDDEQQRRVKGIAKALRRKLDVATQAVGDDPQSASDN